MGVEAQIPLVNLPLGCREARLAASISDVGNYTPRTMPLRETSGRTVTVRTEDFGEGLVVSFIRDGGVLFESHCRDLEILIELLR